MPEAWRPPVVTADGATWPTCRPAGARRGSAACGRSRGWRSSSATPGDASVGGGGIWRATYHPGRWQVIRSGSGRGWAGLARESSAACSRRVAGYCFLKQAPSLCRSWVDAGWPCCQTQLAGVAGHARESISLAGMAYPAWCRYLGGVIEWVCVLVEWHFSVTPLI